MDYNEIEGAPEFLRDLGLKAVFVPRQDGYRAHYALLNTTKGRENSEMYVCGDIEQLVEEAERRKLDQEKR